MAAAGASVALSAVTASADSHDHHAGLDGHAAPGIAQRNDTRAHVANSFRRQGLPAFVRGPIQQNAGAASSQDANDLVAGPVGRGAAWQLNSSHASATNSVTAVSPSKQAGRFAGVAVEDNINQAAGASVAQGGANALANPDPNRGSQVTAQRNVVTANAGNVLRQRFLFVTRPGASAGATGGVSVSIDNDVTQLAIATASQSAANVVDNSAAGSGRLARRTAQSNVALATVRNVITQVFVFIRQGTGSRGPTQGALNLVVHNSVLQTGSAGVTQVAANVVVTPTRAAARSAVPSPRTQLNRATFIVRNHLRQLLVFDLTGRRGATEKTVTVDNSVTQTASLDLTQVATNQAPGAASGRAERRGGTLTQGNIAAATVVNYILQIFVFLLP